VNKETKRIEWQRLRKFLNVAKSAGSSKQQHDGVDGLSSSSLLSSSAGDTIELFAQFLTSDAGLFLKEPLINEIAEIIDDAASSTEKSLVRMSMGLLRPPPGGGGPVDEAHLGGVINFVEIVMEAVVQQLNDSNDKSNGGRLEHFASLSRSFSAWISEVAEDSSRRNEIALILEAASDVARGVAAKVIETRGMRAVNEIFGLSEFSVS